jgi:hypothetical protein
MPIDHLFCFGDLGNGDLGISRSPWKASGTESSGGTMKTIAGFRAARISGSGCVNRFMAVALIAFALFVLPSRA